MTPNRPYLLRALFDWICDNNCTPYLLVDATLEGVEVPQEHVSGGRIVLNASGTAVVNFDITDDAVTFSTRFSGRDTWIVVPMPAVLAIYAKETQEGMTFAPADYPDRKQRSDLANHHEREAVRDAVDDSADESPVPDEVKAEVKKHKSEKGSGSHLKIIK